MPTEAACGAALRVGRAVGILLSLIILVGCSKHPKEPETPPAAAPAASKENQEIHQQQASNGGQETQQQETPAGPAIFNPKIAEPAKYEKMSGVAAAAYQAAAEAAAPYATAAAYDRQAIFLRALPLISRVIDGGGQNQQHLATLIRLDPRFRNLSLRKEVQDKLPSAAIANNDSTPDDTPIPAPGLTNEAPDFPAASGPPVTANHVGPETVINAAKQIGSGVADIKEQMDIGNRLQREVERLANQATSENEDWQKVFELSKDDSLETQAAKVGLKIGFTDFLGQIILYKGGYFLGVEAPDGRIEVWEFSQPVAIATSHKDIDELTRLNTGLSLDAEMNFSVAGNGLFRCYANGWWGSWSAFPSIEVLEIKKSDNWTVRHTGPSLPLSGKCFRLSADELDAALSRTDTTRIVGAAEQAFGQRYNARVNSGELLSLAEAYVALGKKDDASQCIDQLLQQGSLTASDTKRATAVSSDLLFLANPSMGAAFFESVLFGKATHKPSFLDTYTYGVPEHPLDSGHGAVPRKEIAQMAAVYESLVEADPGNSDALFDLSLVYILSGDTEENRHKALQTLEKALKAAANQPPSSGRDLKKLVTQTPTFCPLMMNNDTMDSFDRVLQQCGGSSYFYRGDFGHAELRY